MLCYASVFTKLRLAGATKQLDRINIDSERFDRMHWRLSLIAIALAATAGSMAAQAQAIAADLFDSGLDSMNCPAPTLTIQAVPLNGIHNVLCYPGKTADEQINNCLAASDLCDARGYGTTTQTIASTVEIGIGAARKILLLNPNTIFQPSSASVDMFRVDKNGQISGLHIVFPKTIIYTGKALSVLDTVSAGNQIAINGILIDASSETGEGVDGGYCFYLSPPRDSKSSYIQLVSFSNVTCNGLKYGLYIDASSFSNSYVNGNNFGNFVLTGNGNLLTLNATGIGIGGNIFSGLQTDGLGYAITFSGTAPIVQNVFVENYLWDTKTPVLNLNKNAINNSFTGETSYQITDAANSYRYCSSWAGCYSNDVVINNGNISTAGTAIQLNSKLDAVGASGIQRVYNLLQANEADYSYNYLTIFKLPTGPGWKATTFNGSICAFRGNDVDVTQCAHVYISRSYDSTIYFSQTMEAKGFGGPFQLVTIPVGGVSWVALLYDTHLGAGIDSFAVDGTLLNWNPPDTVGFSVVTSSSPLHSELKYTARN